MRNAVKENIWEKLVSEKLLTYLWAKSILLLLSVLRKFTIFSRKKKKKQSKKRREILFFFFCVCVLKTFYVFSSAPHPPPSSPHSKGRMKKWAEKIIERMNKWILLFFSPNPTFSSLLNFFTWKNFINDRTFQTKPWIRKPDLKVGWLFNCK